MVSVKNDYGSDTVILWPLSLLSNQEVTPLEPKIIYLTENYDDFLKNPALLLSKPSLREDQLRNLDTRVQPGETKMLTIGAALDWNSPKKEGVKPSKDDVIHFGYQLYLSDGSSYFVCEKLLHSVNIYEVII